MKLLSDFDGVWTNPREEALAQGEILEAQLLAAMPAGRREAARDWLARARLALLEQPDRYGWVSYGRLSAFADEDPFLAHSALMQYVEAHAAGDALAALLCDAARERHGSPGALVSAAHAQAVARVEATHGPGVLPDAARAGRALLAAGTEIVLVSNSGDDKLGRWFSHAGLEHASHPARAAGSLRLRGDARKFELDPAVSDIATLGAMRFETRRPRYEAILREEQPDAVVGDVFSLDLSLPLVLRRREPAWRDVRLFWIVRDDTPARVRREIERAAGGEVECVETGFAGVAAALQSRR